jgi:hypothetical protein
VLSAVPAIAGIGRPTPLPRRTLSPLTGFGKPDRRFKGASPNGIPMRFSFLAGWGSLRRAPPPWMMAIHAMIVGHGATMNRTSAAAGDQDESTHSQGAPNTAMPGLDPHSPNPTFFLCADRTSRFNKKTRQHPEVCSLFALP